jgi:hypothetical protein
MGDDKAGEPRNAAQRTGAGILSSSAAPVSNDKSGDDGDQPGVKVGDHMPDKGEEQEGDPRGPVAIQSGTTVEVMAVAMCSNEKGHVLRKDVPCAQCRPIAETLRGMVESIREDVAKLVGAAGAFNKGMKPGPALCEELAEAVRGTTLYGVKPK